MIEISLRPGEFARIGSSPAVEIPLPMVGIREEECRLLLDDEGLLWITPSGAVDPVNIEPPSSFQAGPYHFSIAEVVSSETAQVAQTAPVLVAAPIQQTAPVPQTATVPMPPAYAVPGNPFATIKPKRFRREAAFAAIAMFVILAGALWWMFRDHEAQPAVEKPVIAASGIAPLAPTPAPPAPDVSPAPQPAAPPLPAKSEPPPSPTTLPETIDLEKLARRVRPCVFLLEIRDGQDAIVSTGTGFTISADGMVATNRHVVQGGNKVTAVTEQGAKFSDVQFLIQDEVTDIALMKLDGKNLPFLPLGKSEGVAVGKRVAVYGSPHGLAGTLSEGIISAKRSEPGEALPNNGCLLQTTAPISPGSSGSPLLDAEGSVIGIMTLGSTGGAAKSEFCSAGRSDFEGEGPSCRIGRNPFPGTGESRCLKAAQPKCAFLC